jgi:hypothetical protein
VGGSEREVGHGAGRTEVVSLIGVSARVADIHTGH